MGIKNLFFASHQPKRRIILKYFPCHGYVRKNQNFTGKIRQRRYFWGVKEGKYVGKFVTVTQVEEFYVTKKHINVREFAGWKMKIKKIVFVRPVK